MSKPAPTLEEQFALLGAPQLRRLLVEHLTKQKLGLYWEHDSLERDRSLTSDVVLPVLDLEESVGAKKSTAFDNLVIEGDNFDSLRLLRSTHSGKVRVIYIDPPYNTGNKDWVYNDRYVGEKDRWRHSLWLEFLYQRLVLARDLLTPDGVILVSINDENRARLELLMDEVFPGRRIGSLVWRTKDTGNDSDQLLSQVHEHVLVYGNASFKFNGRATDRAKFRNPDKDTRGDWAPRPITANKNLIQRKNTYYPIQDPKTCLWYPCDPDSVWRYASEARMPKGQKLRGETIEELIRQELIYFPPCKPTEVMCFSSLEEIHKALREGKGPVLPKKKTPLLRDDLPDLAEWVDRRIAPGRPSFKDFWDSKPPEERLAPLGSWIGGVNEDVDFDGDIDEEDVPEVLRSTRGGVANDEIKDILGAKTFNFPKPVSLLKALLSQATKQDDIVLDFFAGSGTTAQAVLELNAEDEGQRRFIMCSSTEATTAEPNKNICRDVCAKRIRGVIEGYKQSAGTGGDFAYIALQKYDPADVHLDATPENVFQLLSLRVQQRASVVPGGPLKRIFQSDELGVVYCEKTSAEVLQALTDLPPRRLAVFSGRPQTVSERLLLSGKEVTSYSVTEALLKGHRGSKL
jgi:adenine-specific DNA-methyltransferase